MRIEFFVSGEPTARPAPKAFYNKRLGRAAVYRPQQPWEKHLSLACEKHAPERLLEGPLRLTADFRFPRRASMPKRREPPHIVKPDLDNCLKNIMDCAQSRLFERDQQVVEVALSKRYAFPEERPGVWITVQEMEQMISPPERT